MGPTRKSLFLVALLSGLTGMLNAHAYTSTANVSFAWATNGTERVWDSRGTNTLTTIANSAYFSTLGGSNATNYYNSDFASAATCATAIAGLDPQIGAALAAVRKYGCRYVDYTQNLFFFGTPAADAGPGGARATGTLTVTDTTLTGVLTIQGTTDEPTGGTVGSVGTGANGYNLRSNDGAPFGNTWYGVTTAGTYTLALTGVFTASSWQITGGTGRFSDGGYLCQQGGTSSPANILCSYSQQPGGAGALAEHLSWGWDLDGNGPGTAMSEIPVNGGTYLGGVLASLAVDANGNITTQAGEVRRAAGLSGCTGSAIVWTTNNQFGQNLVCGTLTAANLVVTGTVVPVPAAVWLFGSALGLLGLARRRATRAH